MAAKRTKSARPLPTKTAKLLDRKTAKPKPAPPTTKLDAVVAALRRPKGATLAELIALTGWQMHSVRGALAGALKKKHGLSIISAKGDGARTYRIEAPR